MSARGPFFTPGRAAQLYEFHRDSDGRADVRERVEEWWDRYEPYCGDTHFLSDARWNFIQRTWEIYLGALLLQHGFTLERPPPNGPDIKIVTREGPVWVEAVAPTSGTKGDKAERRYISKTPTAGGFSGRYSLNKDKAVLRYTSALRDKCIQHEAFQARGVVKAGDRFVVAICGAAIEDADIVQGFPDIVRAVYPVGVIVMNVPIESGAEPWTSVTSRQEVKKASGAPVPTTAFRDPAFAGVSAVMFNPHGPWNIYDLEGREFITVHNSVARNPIERGLFGFGREYWVDQNGKLGEHQARATA